jgi:RNA polymerase sigma-70 factor, ECF subfamily
MTDPKQFESFMQNYQNMVFSTAMRLVANHAEAEDIAQEVFLKAYTRFAELSQSPTAGGWLKTVATNLSLNHFSDLGRADEEGDTREMEFAAPQDLERELGQADRREVVEKALQQLPPVQRVPLVLYHMDGLKYEEIAVRLKISLGKVKTDIFRGREALRKKLAATLAEEVQQS